MKVNRIYEWVCPVCGFIHRSKTEPDSDWVCPKCNDGKSCAWKDESSDNK